MDRADYLGDPDFVQHPRRSKCSSPELRRRLAQHPSTRSRPHPQQRPRPPRRLHAAAARHRTAPAHESTQTTHFSVVDAEGNAVASTYTLNDGFGSGVTAGGLGFLLNDEMDDFTSKLGVPNSSASSRASANAIAPGKRPLSAMTPTIVLKDGNGSASSSARPAAPPSSPPSPTTSLSAADNGLNIQQAVDAPRFHHQYLPDILVD